jgi:hypothetical protein
VDAILLEADGRGSFTFTFSSSRGELSGRVNVGTEGPPDRRSTADKEQAAKNQILALARELPGLRIAIALKSISRIPPTSGIGPFRTSCNVRVESVMRTITDIS